MADNVELDSMSGGAVVATDDIGGVQHQYVKVEYGADGAATPVSASNPMPTRPIDGTITNIGTVASIGQLHNAGTVQAGTLNAVQYLADGVIGTVGQVTNGSIRVTAGTVGTVAAVGQVHNAGTIAGGTVGVVQNLTNGSIVVTAGTVGTVANVAQVHNAGTMAGGTLGVLQNLTNGSIVVTAGTVGTVANVAQVHNAGTIQNGTLSVVTTVSNVTNGTIRMTAGTINTGTINAGTINAGTVKVQPRTTVNILTIGSVWGTNSGIAGTLISAPGASTSILINELSIQNHGTSTLEAGIGFGTNQQGTLVAARGLFGGNGGIQKSYPIPLGGSHSNLPLVIWTNGSGTASFTVSYWTETT
jgi:hypothetical protein